MEKELSRRYLFLSLSFIHKLKTKKNNGKKPYYTLRKWSAELAKGAKGLPCDFLLLAERTLVEILSEDDGRTTSCFIMMLSVSSGIQRFPNIVTEYSKQCYGVFQTMLRSIPNNVTEYFKQCITGKMSILSSKNVQAEKRKVLGTNL